MAYGIIDLAKDAISGNVAYAPVEVQQSRLATCVSCDHFNSLLKQCKACGCFCPAKVKYSQSTCPLGKW